MIAGAWGSRVTIGVDPNTKIKSGVKIRQEIIKKEKRFLSQKQKEKISELYLNSGIQAAQGSTMTA